MGKSRKTVFLSYSHKDQALADELKTHLAPWILDRRVDFWDDSRIQSGEKWKPAIEKAIAEAAVAVLLVTKNFLASKFIMDEELPRIIKRAEQNKLRLMWISAGHASVGATSLVDYQAVNDPKEPLDTLPQAARDAAWVKIAAEIADAVTLANFARGLDVIDETTEPMAAKVEGRAEEPKREHGIVAQYEPNQEQISFPGTTTTITKDDLKLLDEPDREYIDDLEESMDSNYERWRTVRKEKGKAGGALDHEVDGQIKRIEKLICDDLTRILDFLKKMLKYELEDHYGRYRHICNEL